MSRSSAVLSIVLLALVAAVGARLLDTVELVRLAGRPPAAAWAAATAGMAMSYALRGLRLRAEWRGRRDLSIGGCVRVVVLHAAAVNALPLRAGELGYPWLLRRHWGIGLADGASSLVWMRVQDLLVLAWLGALALAMLAAAGGHMGAGAAIALVASAGVVLLATRGGAGAAHALDRLHTLWSGRLARVRWAAFCGPALHAAAAGARRSVASTWLWCASNWFVKVATLAALLACLVPLPPQAAWLGALAGEGAMALPLQPVAGFGTYEAGVAFGASVDFARWRDVLGAALVVHLFVIGCSLAAAVPCAWPAGSEPARPWKETAR